jgi:outer membrane protein OmpA-like peptidoglycan-associated protein
MKSLPSALVLGLALQVAASAVQATPASNLLGSLNDQRMELVDDQRRPAERVTVPLSPLVPTGAWNERGHLLVTADEALQVEGNVTRRIYLVPDGSTAAAEVARYQQLIQASGGELLYGCADEACGGSMAGHMRAAIRKPESLMTTLYPEPAAAATHRGDLPKLSLTYTSRLHEQHYAVGRIQRDDGTDTLIAVLGYSGRLEYRPWQGRSFVMVMLVDEPGAAELQTVATGDAAGLPAPGATIEAPIHFGFDQAQLDTAAKPALDAFAKLLGSQPDLDVLVVGHTDGIGSFDYNMALSKQRADAVASSLSAAYGVDPKQLTAVGAGMMAPIATNATDEGRAQNRRVELVRR